jgi:putative cardiolipin synthase
MRGIRIDKEFAEGESAFAPLIDGIDAIAVRLSMIARAETSIDIQYYLVKNDIVGRVFFNELIRAADRGVSVRLLLDDMFTTGEDAALAALDAHPGISVRVFNPFRRNAFGRNIGALFETRRVNRRLHNKSLTVDDQVTLLGGRNIADEYFGARPDARFGDLDVIAIGPIVREVAASFSDYWQHQTAWPVERFIPGAPASHAALEKLRADLLESNQDVLDTPYAEAVKGKIDEYLNTDGSLFRRAPYRLLVDPPDKGIKGATTPEQSIMTPIGEAVAGADSEVALISPYFVPRRRGSRQLAELRQRGVEVTVVTNSLAANNQFLVHGGYAPCRKPLLRGGVRLFEVRPDAHIPGTEFVNASGAKATLHTKAFLVDRRDVFIGSFNFDPRSANINTEIGVLISDPVLAAMIAERMDRLLPTEAYEVVLDERGRLRWQGHSTGKPVIYHNEPRTTPGQRFVARLARALPIRSQL